MYLDKAKLRFEERGFAHSELVPCTEKDVLVLELQLRLSLPEAYKEFLLWMGRDSFILKGSHCFYEHIPKLQGWALELLKEDDFPEKLPEDAFVFLMHQGYQFLFLRTSEGDDPPIYHYMENIEGIGQASFKVISTSFSEFLLAEIESHASIERKWGNWTFNHPMFPKDQ